MSSTLETPYVEVLTRLTPREREVLQLMANGYSNLGIARRAHLAPKTVEAVCGQIFVKLGMLPSADLNRRVLATRLLLESGVAER